MQTRFHVWRLGDVQDFDLIIVDRSPGSGGKGERRRQEEERRAHEATVAQAFLPVLAFVKTRTAEPGSRPGSSYGSPGRAPKARAGSASVHHRFDATA